MNSNSSSNNKYNKSSSTLSNNIIQDKRLKDSNSPVMNSPKIASKVLINSTNAIKCSLKKVPNKISKTQKPKNTKKNNILINFESVAYTNILKKYNFTNDKYNLMHINYLLGNKSCRLVSNFKERMIIDYNDEFLKRKYSLKESKERIPKFYLYYKHYSIFFGQPFFTHFYFDMILQKNGEKKARIYYKNHYQNGESKDENNENIGFAESGSDEEEEDQKKNLKKDNNGTIFSSGIKDNIDNVTVMTTINSFENNTINLGLNNEKIEIFSENKKEHSNDTTIGELMDDINKGIEEINKAKNYNKNKNKKKKKKNFSLGDNFFNLIKKNINNNAINKKNKKNLINLINNNINVNKKIKNKSIKKKLFYDGHKNINLNLNGGAPLTSNSQRNRNNLNNLNNIQNKKLNINKNNFSSNTNSHNLNSNKEYKKRKLLSYTNDEVNLFIDSNNNNQNNPNVNKYKSPRQINNLNLNNNYLNTINANPMHGLKKNNKIAKINSPTSINKKQIISNYKNLDSNKILTTINNNHNTDKIKICKTLKSFADKNKNKIISKNINKDLATVSGDKNKKLNKLSFKKFKLENFNENTLLKENNIYKKIKGRNVISPLNNKPNEHFTMTNEYTHINNLPFSANKNILNNNNKIISNKELINNFAYQTINNDREIAHQRTKSNYMQSNFKTNKNNNNNNQIISKVMNTEINSAYVKPAIRIKKLDKLCVNKPNINDVNLDNNYENKNVKNNNNDYNYKKTCNNNNVNVKNINNSSNLTKEIKKNNINNIIQTKNLKSTNYNKYILEAIKKSKHQHYNSLTSQINPIHILNLKDNISSINRKKLSNININKKSYKDEDVLQIALSLIVNENSSRNIHNQTNILETLNSNNNNFNTYYKINNNCQTVKKSQNNNKRNYNLNININNAININENNTINNSTYINHTHRINNKKIEKGKNNLKNYFADTTTTAKHKEKYKCIVNLKQKKYNFEASLNSNRNNKNCQSTKNNNNNDNLIFNLNNKKGKKIKTRNYGNKNLNEILTSINSNIMNTVILNNNTVDNRINGINFNKNNNKNINNNNIIKSYHTKSVSSLSDLMFHNKKLISLYKNLSKSK